MDKPEKPYGHSAIVEYRPYGSDEYVQKTIHCKGSKSKLVAQAKRMNCFRMLHSFEVYATREQYVRAFGEGSENGAR